MKARLDKIVLEKGFASSRERAQALIMEGKVFVSGMPATKAGSMFEPNIAIEIKGCDMPYVSRGGLKLEAALDHFGVSPEGKAAMDVGASTGGFADCMLQRGAKKVYCVDVGYGQLAWKIRQDPRVVLIERTNFRYIENEKIPEPIDLAVIDVSFISLTLVVPKALEFLKQDGEIIALIKPQFEVGKGEVDKGGIVRDELKRQVAVEKIQMHFENLSLQDIGTIQSPILGQKGNAEYLIYARRG
ncbi:MAG: TlyA family RNA methyltransferase [Nitrospirae bacterium]|nr:TlyA family RNA methyltransferase [Nitrospirota bacterium]